MVMMVHPCPYAYAQPVPRHRRAGIAAAALLALPLVAAVGLTFDALRGLAVQARLEHAVDAAALAGGRVFIDEQRDGHIRSFFQAAFTHAHAGVETGPLRIEDDAAAGRLVVTGTATVRSPFLTALGLGGIGLGVRTVEARAVVRRPGPRAEPVLDPA